MRELPFIVGCGFAIVCLLLPAAWHIRSRNSGTLLYLAWSLTGNLIYFINSIVWAGNIGIPAPIWCDISSKLIIGLGVGLPCASLCIQRRLYAVSCLRNVSTSSAQKLRALIIDLLIGLGIPIMVMAFHYIVQGHRFDIIEDVGCWPTIYLSAPTIPLVYMWPLIISLVSVPYCILSYRSFYRRRADFQRYLATNEPGLNVDRYLRLMALASLEILVVLPLNLFSIVVNVTTNPMLPYTSWEDVHYNFSRVAYFTNFIFQTNHQLYVEFTVSRWAIPLSGFLFFFFFGLSVEARKDYSRAATYTLEYLGIHFVSSSPNSAPSRSLLNRFLHQKSSSTTEDPFANDNTLTDLPTHNPRRRRDTFASFDSKDDTQSTHTILGGEPPIKLPDAVYSPLYRSSHAARPSLSPSDISDLDTICHTGTLSTAYRVQNSPRSPTSASWDAKPLPPIPSSRPTSVATVVPTNTTRHAMYFADEPSELPVPVESAELGADLHGADGNESIYYTPAAQRLSLMSTEYQPSIPDIPGAWFTGPRKKGKGARPNPFF